MLDKQMDHYPDLNNCCIGSYHKDNYNLSLYLYFGEVKTSGNFDFIINICKSNDYIEYRKKYETAAMLPYRRVLLKSMSFINEIDEDQSIILDRKDLSVINNILRSDELTNHNEFKYHKEYSRVIYNWEKAVDTMLGDIKYDIDFESDLERRYYLEMLWRLKDYPDFSNIIDYEKECDETFNVIIDQKVIEFTKDNLCKMYFYNDGINKEYFYLKIQTEKTKNDNIITDECIVNLNTGDIIKKFNKDSSITKNRLKKILDIFNYEYHENLKSTADRLRYFMRPEKADFSKLIRKYLK